MHLDMRPATYEEIESMRDLYRAEQNCQIIHDSFPRRGLANPFLITSGGSTIGYGTLSNKYGKGRLTEFYVVPAVRQHARDIFLKLIESSGATHIEAQTNIRPMLLMLYDFGTAIKAENVLFEDAFESHLTSDGILRPDGEGAYVVEAGGSVVARGGFLCHYNPPYGDIYMEVEEPARRKGYGSFIVQELKRVCYAAGRKPAARCNADNLASRRTLEKAGMLPCGRLLVGRIRAPR